MSTDESIDPRMVEQAQQQIRALVDEIAGLSRRDISADEFFPEYLQRVVAALAAVGGVSWKVGAGGGLELQAQMNFRESQLADQEEIISHRKLIHRCFTSGEPAIVPPRTGGPEEHGFNPTEFLLVIAPVKIGDGAYVGSGSVITDSVPAGALALGRGKQVVKEGWAKRLQGRQSAGKKKTPGSK